jgi:F-type H+-transporting ATPase subunit epsilon
LVTPVEMTFHGQVTSIIAPGAEGYLGVLPGHIPLVTSLKPGTVTIVSEGRRRFFDVGPGYMEVNPDSVIIITESAEIKGERG